MDSHPSVTSAVPDPQRDITETQSSFPYDQVKLDPSIAESELEKVFKDLYLGIRVETTLERTAADPSKLTNAIRAEARLVKRFEDRGTIFMSATATSEFARAYEVLTGAFWFDSISGGTPPQAFRSGSGIIVPSESVSCLITSYSRYLSCVSSVGWACFTLLTLSAAFRSAVKHLHPDQWEHFSRLIGENKGSFELICRIVRPKYGALLEKMLQERPAYSRQDTNSDFSLYNVCEAYNRWIDNCSSLLNLQKNPGDVFDATAARYQLHPQRWCVSLDKKDAHMLTSPYVPIEHSILGRDFKPETDPRVDGNPDSKVTNFLKEIRKARCDMCTATGMRTCDATPQYTQPLIELFETQDKGVGVRSLQRIKGDIALAEYAGYITKDVVFPDPYVLHGPRTENDSRFYYTTSRYMGNWTRFINHSCTPNSAFTCLLFPNKEMQFLVSLREIKLFEEITVNYGRGFFAQRGMSCLCGTPECMSGVKC